MEYSSAPKDSEILWAVRFLQKSPALVSAQRADWAVVAEGPKRFCRGGDADLVGENRKIAGRAVDRAAFQADSHPDARREDPRIGTHLANTVDEIDAKIFETGPELADECQAGLGEAHQFDQTAVSQMHRFHLRDIEQFFE